MIRPLLFLLTIGAALPAVAAAAPPPAAVGGARACGAAPKLAVPANFPDPRRIFTPAGRSFRLLETRFAAAHGRVCRSRLLRWPLLGPLLLKNAPDANTTSIYRDEEEGEGPRSGPLVIEHPFIGHDGRAAIPSVEELRSAILCSAHNADPSDGPVGDILECLVD